MNWNRKVNSSHANNFFSSFGLKECGKSAGADRQGKSLKRKTWNKPSLECNKITRILPRLQINRHFLQITIISYFSYLTSQSQILKENKTSLHFEL